MEKENNLKKAFLIEVEEQKLKALDTHLNEIWSSRANFFRGLVDNYLLENKSSLINSARKIVNYLDKYSQTEMAVIMENSYDWSVSDDLTLINSEEEIKFRTYLDFYADLLGKRWFVDWHNIVREVYLWLRYLGEHLNDDKPMDLFEYIDRQYTNPYLITY